MSDDSKLLAYVISGGVGLILFMLALGFLFSWISCNAQTKDIGFPSRYEMMSGCMIEPQEGQWIPLNNWRMFED